MTGAHFSDWLVVLLALGSLVASGLLGQVGATRRTLSVVAVLFGATLVVSGMLRLVPGDPIENILGDQAPQDAQDALAKELGLVDQTGQKVGFVAQYAHFVVGVGSGAVMAFVPASDEQAATTWKAGTPARLGVRLAAYLGPKELRSYRTRRPVREMIGARLPNTARLALAAMLVAILLGVFLGVMAAWRKGTVVDGVAMAFAISGVAFPRPALGPILILIFALGLRWFPVSGAEAPGSVVLPALSLGTALAAMLARLTRASLLEVLSQDFIRTARAKGLSEKVVMFKHALRNALIPVLTVIGLQLGAVLAGAVITEKIFVWPGLGLLLLESIRRLDVPIVQACVLTIALAYVLANLLTDVLYRVVDPRIRLGGTP